MNVNIVKEPKSLECIRCGKCKNNCPAGAITSGYESFFKPEEIRQPKTGMES